MLRALCATPVLPWERRWLVCGCPGQRLDSCSWPFVFSLGPLRTPDSGMWAFPWLPSGTRTESLQRGHVGSQG